MVGVAASRGTSAHRSIGSESGGGGKTMRKGRFSIARLMAAVLVAALGFAALRNASEDWAGLMLLVTCGALMLALVGALCRGPDERAWWLGFALFGGGYLALVHGLPHGLPSSLDSLPTIPLVRSIGS